MGFTDGALVHVTVADACVKGVVFHSFRDYGYLEYVPLQPLLPDLCVSGTVPPLHFGILSSGGDIWM